MFAKYNSLGGTRNVKLTLLTSQLIMMLRDASSDAPDDDVLHEKNRLLVSNDRGQLTY